MHCQVGNSRAVFGRMLVDVARVVQPALHIADGVIAMEGQGPRKGDPRPWGWILASNNPFALIISPRPLWAMSWTRSPR